MTRDEEIRKAAGNVAIRDNKGHYAHGFLMQALREAFTEGARWADSHPHWISVEDELPKGEEAICLLDNGERVIMECNMVDEMNRYSTHHYITHWMALPLPPAVVSKLERTEKKWKGGEE